MMGKTHLAVGMAVGAALAAPDPAGCAAALAAGAFGGVLADADALRNDKNHDALTAEGLAFGVVLAAIAAAYLFGWGLQEYVSANAFSVGAGIAGVSLMWLFGIFQNHRGCMHSLIALLLFSVCMTLISPAVGLAGMAGYASHLALDLTNRRGLCLLWPMRRRFCLRLFYADKKANAACMWLGLAAAAAITFAKCAG